MSDPKKPAPPPRDDGKPGADDLKRELSSLWAQTQKSLGGLKDVVVRGGQAGKARLDAELLKRQRTAALAQLGEAVLHLADDGEIDLPDDTAELVERIHALHKQIEAEEREAAKLFVRDASDDKRDDRSDEK
jgi:hypothetical protein